MLCIPVDGDPRSNEFVFVLYVGTIYRLAFDIIIIIITASSPNSDKKGTYFLSAAALSIC